MKKVNKTKKKKKLQYGGNQEYQQSQAQANGIVGIVGKANPIVGAGLKIGQAIGSQTMDENGLYKSKAGQFIDNSINPTTGIQNLKDVMKDPSAANIANQLSLGLIGKGATQKKREQMKNQQMMQEQIAWRNANTPESTMPTYKHGGKLANVDVVGGGTTKRISPDAVEVQANNPNQTDSVELENAYVDHNEIIDKQDRVFSDNIKAPSGRTVAKEAKRLEKMKSRQGRFGDANSHIDRKLDELFSFQESSKVGLNGGGKIPLPTVATDATRAVVSKGMPITDVKVPEDYSILDAAMGNKPPSNIMLEQRLAGMKRSQIANTPVTLNRLLNGPTLKKGYNKGGPLGGPQPFKYAFDPKDAQYNPYDDPFLKLPKPDTNPLTEPIRAKQAMAALQGQDTTMSNAYTNPLPTSGDSSMVGAKPGFNWKGVGASAAQFAPDLVNAFLVGKQAKPKAPTREKAVFLDRINADAQLAENARTATNTNRLIKNTTAQAGQALGNIGAIMAKRLSADNQVRQSVNNANSEIQGREAAINTGINARNVANENAYKADQVAAKNQKLSQYSQIASNVGTKALQMRQEKQRREYDKMSLDVLRQKYKDSGLDDRFVNMIMKRYEDQAYKQGYFKYGGKLPGGKKRKC